MPYICHKIIHLANIDLQTFFADNNFIKVKLHFIASNHYKIVAHVNGVKGWFIIDTGASTTFISNNNVNKFKLKLEQTSLSAQGAGSAQIEAKISNNNLLKIGRWRNTQCSVALIDLDPINSAFVKSGLKQVDGIIGADVLKKANAVIDYGRNYLYVK